MGKIIDLRNLSPEEFRKWQLKLLEILVYFRDFCDSHNLRFYISAGTCIGVIRHKGFIPWDEDLDVIMPREDYEKLPMLWDKYADKTRFTCCRSTKDKCVSFPMTVIRSEDTTCIFDHSVSYDIPQGLKIDVEFYDSVPSNKYIASINKFLAAVMALYRTQRIPRQTSVPRKILAGLLLGLVPFNGLRWKISCMCEKQITKYNIYDTEYVRYIATAPYKRAWFEKAVYKDFEGYQMPIPCGFHEMLTLRYGDYMQLPPKEARYPKSDNIAFYDLDNSYKLYKGKEYCVKN